MTLTGDATNDVVHEASALELAAEKEFIPLHVITKNVQSIRTESRFEDVCTELVARDHDLIFVSETWRSDVEECFVLPSGGHTFLSGGLSHQGVGIAVSAKMMAHLSDISFHPYSPRLCLLKFKYCGLIFCSLSCCFLTRLKNTPFGEVSELACGRSSVRALDGEEAGLVSVPIHSQ